MYEVNYVPYGSDIDLDYMIWIVNPEKIMSQLLGTLGA